MPPPALDYAPPPTARRRWMRRLRRGWPVALLLIVAGLGIAYGPGLWRRWQVIKLQEACMMAELPADRPVLETNPVAAQALVAARPGEYQLDVNGWAVRPDPRWAALAAKLGLPGPTGAYTPATVFMGERFTPSGARRLVAIQDDGEATVIEPGNWTRRPRVVWSGFVRASEDNPSSGWALRPKTTAAGTPDPTDRSRWTVSFTLRGVQATWEYRLYDDGRISKYLLDTAGVTARLEDAPSRTPAPPPAGPAPREAPRAPGIGG